MNPRTLPALLLLTPHWAGPKDESGCDREDKTRLLELAPRTDPFPVYQRSSQVSLIPILQLWKLRFRRLGRIHSTNIKCQIHKQAHANILEQANGRAQIQSPVTDSPDSKGVLLMTFCLLVRSLSLPCLQAKWRDKTRKHDKIVMPLAGSQAPPIERHLR